MIEDKKKLMQTGAITSNHKSSPFQVFQMSSNNSGFGRKEDLAERVMESIKTLSKKEEEVKGTTTKVNKKPVAGGEVLNFKNSSTPVVNQI